MTHSIRNKKQILIIGGGMVGLTAAIGLLQSGFEVEVKENNQPDFKVDQASGNEPYDRRVSALIPVTVNIFKNLGIWENLHQCRHGYFNTIKIWEKNIHQPLLFDGIKSAQFPLGYIVENTIIKKILWDKYLALKLGSNTGFDKILNPNTDKPILMTKNSADLIIAADGANSLEREAANIKTYHKNYDQTAIVATVQTEKPHQYIARQRFIGTGALAFLPLSDPHYCSIVFSQPHEKSQLLMGANPEDFNTILQDNLEGELGKIKLIDSPKNFPLSLLHAKNYVKPGFALIGDAAHVIHPLAGAGVNMGFLDAVCLIRILKKACDQHRDIGHLHTLRKYERERKAENSLMLNSVDLFTRPDLRKPALNLAQKLSILPLFLMNWMGHHGQENSFI